jgi:hypothetical protein
MPMTCDFCLGDKKEVRPFKLVGRSERGYPITCHKLECGHTWHVPRMTACDCIEPQRPD